MDMDGVLSTHPIILPIGGKIDFVNREFFRYLDPVSVVIDVLIRLNSWGRKLYILTGTPNSFAYDEKQEWLDNYISIIPRKQRFFVNQGKHKVEMLLNLIAKFRLPKEEVLLVDDVHSTLVEARQAGINAMHPSEFLTHDFIN